MTAYVIFCAVLFVAGALSIVGLLFIGNVVRDDYFPLACLVGLIVLMGYLIVSEYRSLTRALKVCPSHDLQVVLKKHGVEYALCNTSDGGYELVRVP